MADAATAVLALAYLFQWPPQAIVQDGDTFDFVVVGSGCGAIVADRLSENSSVRVLLIEAGTYPSNESIMPGTFPLLQNSYEDWNETSIPESTTKHQKIGAYKLSTGKALGGGSTINHLLHLRGDKDDFDTWASYLGDDSWSSANVRKYFKKSENMQDADIMASHADYHGTEGPVIVSRQPDDATHNLLKAFSDIGVPTVIDLNADDNVGCAEASYIIGDGVRQSTAYAYLNKKTRDNLYVLTETLAEKIIIENDIAKGVILRLASGKKINVYASKEVIISAGSFNSPKILMLSGIGPADHLKSMGIDVIKDLPVGQGMQDHNALFLVNKLEESTATSETLPLTKFPFPILLASVNLDDSKSYADYLLIGLVFAQDKGYTDVTCSTLFSFTDEICSNFSESVAGRNQFISLIGTSQPKSRGYVQLKSSDPDDKLVISESFYSDPEDFTNMQKYLTHFLTIYNSAYFQDIKAEIADPGLEECGEMDVSSEDYWKCYIKSMTVHLFHYSGTCAMGSVVDSKMKVYGIDNLRVVDVSTMPFIVRANTLAAGIMMAEKISDDIKNEYSL
ncbi:uncharacterized protein LOC114241120 [Bombyx mandarina]|uniref:Uncharacterized protein LOC114241120 n=1 Tax=Bombyx mandarina TaxID=7092 RepID=A0A6J2JE96_BOMMA|nr:uncharacterized protein LOC114241120 [Bombyx mandarina]